MQRSTVVRHSLPPHRTRRLLIAASGVVLLVGLLPMAGSAAPVEQPGRAPGSSGVAGEALPNYDARHAPETQKTLAVRSAQLAANPPAGVRELRKQLGVEGIVQLDPVTRTPRLVARLDGYLSGPSSRPAKQIALDYLRSHASVFGLSTAQISGLQLRNAYTDVAGIRHLSFIQTVNGVAVFGAGVKAHIAKDGRIIRMDGSPVAAASIPASLAGGSMTADKARAAAVGDVFGKSTASIKSQARDASATTEFTNGDVAQKVVFQTLSGLRPAWQTITLREGYIHVIDAVTGRILFRQSTVAKDSGKAWGYWPGAPAGGVQETVQFGNWLPTGSVKLDGNNAHTWLDLNDNDLPDVGEDIRPNSPGNFRFPFTDFSAQVGGACSALYQCSWDPNVPFSWQTNAKQSATQTFVFVNRFHDHLKAGPIGFTRAAGNFEFIDNDGVEVNALDGANINGDGLPDGNHADNANMNTPPDGIPPRMQMYLFPVPGDPTDPFIASNSGDEADVVYHEYTHGLSNRLVVDVNGISTLGNIQAGSMGEAWSDWYAMDFLVNLGLQADGPADGDVRIGEYVGAGQDLIRTQPLDCAVGSTSAKCPGTPLVGPGGYTYGDFGKIIGGPEVHADGEIWGETLWDLRKAIGTKQSESLVTRAMELSPANPSFLDMRNSILQADLVINGGSKSKKIWQVFAGRGMGWFAGSVDGDDTAPVEDFSTPPSANTPRGALTGRVTDQDTGAPVPGAVVAFGGHNSGFAGDYAATTDASGRYTISGIIPGTYPKVFAKGAGYDQQVTTVSVSSGTNVRNWTVRRDWAATAGGSSVVDFNGQDFSAFGCGPAALFDQLQGNGWSTDTVYTGAGPLTIEPRFVVVELPVAVNVNQIFVNPSNTCGDPGSSSTGDYTVETSADGTTWTVASSGHFGIADRNYHAIPLTGGTAGVKFIRYTMRSAQVAEAGGTSCPGPFGGCTFVDSQELGVYGAPA